MNFVSPRSRRRVAWVTAPLAAVLALSACGGGANGTPDTSSGPEPQTITLAFGPANPGEHHFQDLAAAYEKAHAGVKINLLKLPGESYAQAIATRVQAGNAPDLFQAESGAGQTNAIGGFAKGNLLLPLTDPSFTQSLPKGEDAGQFEYNGQVVGVPIRTSVNGIVFDEELAKQTGVTITATTTLDDVIAQCATAEAKGKSIYGLAGAIPANPGIAAMELAASTVYGPTPDWDAQRKAGSVKFATSDGWKATLESLQSMYKSNCFQKGAAGAGFDALTNGAGQGKLFGFFAPSGAAKSIMDAAGGHVKLVVLPFPAPAGTKTYLSVSSDTVIAASAKTKSPKLATDFLKFLSSGGGSAVVATAEGTIPVNATDTSKLAPQYGTVADLINAKDYRGFGTVNWPNGKVYDALGSGVTGIFTGQKTVDQVLQAMDAAWR